MLALHLTVLGDLAVPAGNRVPEADLRLRVQPGTVVAQALAPLARVLGVDHVVGASVGGIRLDGSHRLGDPPLLDGATVTLLTRSSAPPAVLELRVTSGQLPARTVALAAGRWVVGRGAASGVRLDDPDVSRSHVELAVLARPDGGVSCTVRDLGSTNGTLLRTRSAGSPPDRQVGAGPVPVPTGAELLLGSSTLTVDLRLAQPGSGGGGEGGATSTGPPPLAAAHADGSGTVQVNRAPRVRSSTAAVVVEYPDEPAPPARVKVPWAALLLPLLVAVPVAIFWHQPTFLILAAASPLLGLAQLVQDRRARRGESVRAAAAYRKDCTRLDADLARALAEDGAARQAQDPGPEHVLAVAAGPGRQLWQRTPADDDFLCLRVGLAQLPARLTVRRGRVEQPPVQHPAPLVVPLRTAGVVGICGPDDARRALAGWLVGQAVTWHSPRELRLVVLSGGQPRSAGPGRCWAWTSWLPHADPTAPAAGGTAGTHTLLVLDGAAELRRRPGIAELLSQAAGSGVTVLCLARHRAELPVECTGVAELGPGASVLELAGRAAQSFDPDLPTAAWRQHLARHLAPLRDATPDPQAAALPELVRLLDLVTQDPAAIAERWLTEAERRGGLPAVIGATATGPLVVDLARDGPHALVAGTTGAGKSELLTTLVTALAIELPPHRLAFLLVDYKGGTALRRLADLPHVTGVLTDLDAAAAQRALTSLRAELRRRERWLSDGPDRRAVDLPRLVVVVDEFRVLAEEQPDLLAGLVRVATVGRGLGVHLVLATQRPAGVVSPDIRANTNLRIALRLRDRSDSVDVLDRADAAELPADRPGRGILRVGNGPAVTFQTAHLPVDPPAEAGADPVTVEVVDVDPAIPTSRLVRALVPADGTQQHPGLRSGGLGQMVEALRSAARRAGTPPAPVPWLEPLPNHLPWEQLWQVAGIDPDLDLERDRDLGLPLGVADLPEQQARALLRWHLLRDGHLAVIGGPGSGRTTVLRTIARAAEATAAVGPAGPGGSRRGVHVHAIDAGGGLAGLVGRTVGTVVPADDLERVRRLLALLSQEVRSRQAQRAQGPAGEPPPVVLLLVDGWESVEEAWASVDHGRSVEDLLRLARDGSGVGVRLAVTGGRALLGAAPGAILTERLLLGDLDPMVALLAGVPADRLPRPSGAAGSAAGRLLRITPGAEPVEARAAWPGPPGTPEGSSPADPGPGEPLRLSPLPVRVTVDALARSGLAPELAAVGIGGDRARVVGLPLRTARGALVCAGPAGGRSTALATLAQSITQAGRPVLVVSGGSATGLVPPAPDRASGPDPCIVRYAVTAPAELASQARHALEELAAAVPEAAGGAVLLLDDGWPHLPGVEDLAIEHLSAGPRLAGTGLAGTGLAGTGLAVIACATPADASLAFRGLLPMLRATRTGLILGARTAADGECLGVRLAPCAAGPPGRGVLVVAGRVEPVQVAVAATLDGAATLAPH